MSISTRPFFIVSSGRSGTQMMEKLLGSFPQIEMHHEYLCTHLQPLAVRYYLELASHEEAKEAIIRLVGSAVHYSDRALWGDSSNKLSWLVDVLAEVFPEAQFIHLVRDGRKVTSSFFHKLADECYDDRSAAILQAWMDDPGKNPCPPPEKKYWWNLPRPGTLAARGFRRYDQFQRICFHWGEVNRILLERLAVLDQNRVRMVRLEDLTADDGTLQDLLAFLELPYEASHAEIMRRPHNVNRPEDYPLTEEQARQLAEIAGDMMRHFGYDRTPEYRMSYGTMRAAEGERS
jgi:hypothetical protein